MNCVMRLSTETLNIAQVRLKPVGHDLFDLYEAQVGAHASCQARWRIGFAFSQFTHGAQGGVHFVHREADRMREICVQQQELRNPQWPQLGGVFLAVSLEGGTIFQKSYPLKIFVGVDGVFPGLGELSKMGGNQCCQAVSSLHKAPKLNILPALAMAHCRVGYALKKMGAIEGSAKEQLRVQDPALACGGRDDLEIEPVELLPHL